MVCLTSSKILRMIFRLVPHVGDLFSRILKFNQELQMSRDVLDISRDWSRGGLILF